MSGIAILQAIASLNDGECARIPLSQIRQAAIEDLPMLDRPRGARPEDINRLMNSLRDNHGIYTTMSHFPPPNDYVNICKPGGE